MSASNIDICILAVVNHPEHFRLCRRRLAPEMERGLCISGTRFVHENISGWLIQNGLNTLCIMGCQFGLAARKLSKKTMRWYYRLSSYFLNLIYIITLSCCCFAWFDTEMPGSTAKSMVRQQKALPSMPESVFRWANTPPPPFQNVVKSMKLVIK